MNICFRKQNLNTKMTKLFRYALLLCGMLLLNGATFNYYEPVNLDGIVIIKYTNINKRYVSFWLQDTYYYSTDFENGIQISNGDLISSITSECDLHGRLTEKEALIALKGKNTNLYKTNLYRSEHFSNQQRRKKYNGYHIGGDIYYAKTDKGINDSTNIFIAFKIIGYGSLFKEVCDNFLNRSKLLTDHCQYDSEDFKVPFMNLYQYDTIYSLSSADMIKYNLVKAEIDSFRVTACEK